MRLNKHAKKLFILSCHKTKEMCEKAVSKELFMLKYCFDKCKSQEMGKEAVNLCPPLLKFIPAWSVTN